MKILKYLPAILALLFFSCGSDGENKQKAIIKVDVSDVRMYTGQTGSSPKEYEITEAKQDSILKKHFGSRYDVGIYSDATIEFFDGRLTYIYTDSTNISRKIIANYIFDGDSLFALKSDGGRLFVALGTNENNLYRMKGFFHSKSSAKDTIISKDEKLDLAKVLGYAAANSNDMTQPNDTIIWLNAIYPFE